jgi:hypothetical protein
MQFAGEWEEGIYAESLPWFVHSCFSLSFRGMLPTELSVRRIISCCVFWRCFEENGYLKRAFFGRSV